MHGQQNLKCLSMFKQFIIIIIIIIIIVVVVVVVVLKWLAYKACSEAVVHEFIRLVCFFCCYNQMNALIIIRIWDSGLLCGISD